MPRLKAKIKYNDGIWREQYLPTSTRTFEMYNDLVQFKELGYIQDLLSSKGGLIFVVLIPCLVILSYDIMKIFKKIGQKTRLIKE